MSAMTTPAMRPPMPGIEVRISRLRASAGSAAIAASSRRSTSAQAASSAAITARWLAAISASKAWARRVFSMATSSVSWRRRVESALSAIASGAGAGRRRSGMVRAKRAMRPASSRSVLAMRPSAVREGAHLARIGEADLEALRDQRRGQGPGIGADRLERDAAGAAPAHRLDQRRDAGSVVPDAQGAWRRDRSRGRESSCRRRRRQRGWVRACHSCPVRDRPP